jgi:hypothetical protein
MNARASQIGMHDTEFTNPPGVDNGDPKSTAYDMYLLAREAMKNALFRDLVGTTSYTFPQLALAGEAGIYKEISNTINYGWLQQLQARDPRIIGLKPGSTPAAGNTGVVAARQSVAPYRLAFANGFGWRDVTSSYRYDALAKLAQLGLKNCDPEFQLPVDISGTFAETTWHFTEPDQIGALAAALDPTFTAGDRGEETTIVVHPAVSAPPAGSKWDLQVQYRSLFPIKPGAAAIQGIRSFQGHGGITLRNLERRPVALSCSVSHPNNSIQTMVLDPGEMFTIPPFPGRAPASRPDFELKIQNHDNADVLLALDIHNYGFTVDFNATPAFQQKLIRSPRTVRDSINITMAPIGRIALPQRFAVALNAPRNGHGYRPKIVVTHCAVHPAGNGKLGIRLDWSCPSGFYDGFNILAQDGLEWKSVWNQLDRATVGSDFQHSWSGRLPDSTMKFFRVEGVPK